MRAAVLLVGLAACGGHRAAGPAWPKSAGTVTVDDPAEDGGESLEPRTSSDASAAIEISDGGGSIAAAVSDAAPELVPAPAAPSTTPPPPPTGEVIEIQVEDITITPVDPPPPPSP